MADFYHLVGLKEKLQILKQDREEDEEERLIAARDKRVSWSRTDKPLRQIQSQSNGAPTIAKPFQNFGPPPPVYRPGLAPATPLTQPSRLSSAAPGPSSLARSVSPDPILAPSTPEGKRKRVDESQDSISTHYKRVALEPDMFAASPVKSKSILI
jgi:chromosome transmission fidelity protein 4